MSITLAECLENGPLTSKEIQAATGQTQSAVSRQITALGNRVIRLRSGRTPRYALTCNAFGADDKLPLYRVDPHGHSALLAVIRPLAHGAFFVEPCQGMPEVLLGDNGNGLYDGLS